MADNTLARVKRAAENRRRMDVQWRNAIKQAVDAGCSLREVGRAAGVTHVRVLHIINGSPPADPVYHKAHRAVEKARGAAKECSRCGPTDPDKFYEWANLTGNYADVTDYERMCRTCHRRYDKERRLRGE